MSEEISEYTFRVQGHGKSYKKAIADAQQQAYRGAVDNRFPQSDPKNKYLHPDYVDLSMTVDQHSLSTTMEGLSDLVDSYHAVILTVKAKVRRYL